MEGTGPVHIGPRRSQAWGLLGRCRLGWCQGNGMSLWRSHTELCKDLFVGKKTYTLTPTPTHSVVYQRDARTNVKSACPIPLTILEKGH